MEKFIELKSITAVDIAPKFVDNLIVEPGTTLSHK